MSQELIFDLHRPDGKCSYIPESDIPANVPGPAPELLRSTLDLPQVAEPQVVSHFVNLSVLNHHVDKDFYPLGSCTMKYNPKVNEAIAGLDGFARIHPHQPDETIQGALYLMYMLENMLSEITGLPAVTLQPAAGSHGELTALYMVSAYFKNKGEKRTRVLVPDSAHGTNPASVVMAGFEPQTIPSNPRGRLDLNALKAALTPDVAALMITNPNTVGVFEDQIAEVAHAVHSAGALLYMDGANMNAMLGLARPGDLGFDLVHLNLHKTFSTPHGGGGPGAGPVAVRADLEPFMPGPRVRATEGEEASLYLDYNRPLSIGKVQSFYGNFGMLVRAATYIRSVGGDGLRKISETAILNANYLLAKLKHAYKLPYDQICTHEVVFSADNQVARGIKAVDIAKRLLDFGMHAPTINFPLVIHEALMIEPTETVPLEMLDRFIDAMLQIDEESKTNPDMLHHAPHTTPVSRFNEAAAARELDISYKK